MDFIFEKFFVYNFYAKRNVVGTLASSILPYILILLVLVFFWVIKKIIIHYWFKLSGQSEQSLKYPDRAKFQISQIGLRLDKK